MNMEQIKTIGPKLQELRQKYGPDSQEVKNFIDATRAELLASIAAAQT